MIWEANGLMEMEKEDHNNISRSDAKDGEGDLDSIDGNDTSNHSSSTRSSDDDEEVVSPSKIVARIKHGTIMNGRGEFVNKGSDDDSGWLDEARANRKIADLEIEKTSLLAVNTTLESTVRRQAARIAELEKLLELGSDAPPTPVSDKAPDEDFLSDKLSDEEVENDQEFQKIKGMVLNLIDRAEAALSHKTKLSGRVVLQQIDDHDEVTIQKSPARRSWSVNDTKTIVLQKSSAATRRSWSPNDAKTQLQLQQQQQQQNIAITNRQHQRPSRRGSTDSVNSTSSSGGGPKSPRPSIVHTKASMARTLSRSSSPAVMVSSPPLTPPPPLPSPSPRPHNPPALTIVQRSRPPSRASSLRRLTHPQEVPRWR
ncbi:hypothetical protein BX666DRAFT_1879157 [Dichotomocladium elegans]|nr:hypothetical protein BX666DRAFT_1879157 [Dichotomocladium elegans]